MPNTQAPSHPMRGEVWNVNFKPQVGSEITKVRPAVVMSLDSVGILPLRLVVPITDWKSHYASQLWFVRLDPSADNGLTKVSGADCFQVKSMDLSRFLKRLGRLTAAQLDEIAAGVALTVGYQP